MTGPHTTGPSLLRVEAGPDQNEHTPRHRSGMCVSVGRAPGDGQRWRNEGAMDINEMMQRARDAIDVRRVFGEPQTFDGVTVIPVASVGGGAGGGSGTEASDGEGNAGSGEGGGFGGGGRPVGAYVVRDGHVTWRPAIDANRAISWGGIVLLALILSVSRVRRKRIRAAG
jgi:uncharacterized spore protein YtfJ